MRNMVKIIAAILSLTMLTSCGQLDDTSKAETKATSATITTTVGTWKPSFKNATTFTTTTTTSQTTTTKTTTTKATTTKKVTTTVQNNSNNGNGGVAYYPPQDNNNYNYEDNQPSYNENNGDNDYSYEQPQQTEQPRQTTTTKKEEQPSKPSGNKITQADIDAMKKELQEYSNSKADFIRENYTEFDGYGVEYNTLEEFFEMSVNKKTPTNAGYNDEYTIYFDEKDIKGITKSFKEDIDYIYRRTPNTHIVIYIETCSSYWAVYLLN